MRLNVIDTPEGSRVLSDDTRTHVYRLIRYRSNDSYEVTKSPPVGSAAEVIAKFRFRGGYPSGGESLWLLGKDVSPTLYLQGDMFRS